MKSIAVVACGLAALATTAATDASAYFNHGTHTWTAVSGYSGSYSKRTLVEDSTKAIYIISGYESSDDPILFRLTQNSLQLHNTFSWAHREIEVRDGYNFGSGKSANVGKERYIIAIRVCTTDENESSKRKIKGVRVWPGRLRSDRTVVSDGAAEEYSRTNCKKWRNKVSCPANAVVTGIKGYYKDSKKGFSGLAVRCSTIR